MKAELAEEVNAARIARLFHHQVDGQESQTLSLLLVSGAQRVLLLHRGGSTV